MMKSLLIVLIKGYRLFFSPWVGASCRFQPTCSQYGLEALQKHGATAGAYLTVTRVLRCHPWCAGGKDCVPDKPPRLFRHLFPNSSK